MFRTEIWRKRRGHMGQNGFSTVGALVGLAGTATLGALLVMTGGEQVGAAETTACEYDKTIVMTAVEAFHLSGELEYPAAEGADGLDQVRAAGWLATESNYWRYAGLDGSGHPQYVERNAANSC